jgi:hypothetical protein
LPATNCAVTVADARVAAATAELSRDVEKEEELFTRWVYELPSTVVLQAGFGFVGSSRSIVTLVVRSEVF